jgi:phospholipid transport system substrate-binding protein
MPNRRSFMTLAATALLVTAPPVARQAAAQSANDRAAAFVKATADKLVAVVNGPGTPQEKRPALTQIIESAVDVDGVARFCLGRFWNTATPEQQKEYVALFHGVLVNNVTSKLGEYRGVSYTMGRTQDRDDGEVVSTVISRPNNPPTAVDWVISDGGSAAKIIDVIAEGTSLRVTQRSDYAAYLSHNNFNLDALISAMRQQIADAG